MAKKQDAGAATALERGTSTGGGTSNHMTHDDIKRCAQGMVEEFGPDAAHQAHQSANNALLRHAWLTATIWSDIATEIDRLQAEAGGG